MPSFTCSGSGSVLMTLPRTLVPSQSTMPATKGTGTPGAANATMVNDRRVPSLEISTCLKSVALHEAHALRRSKNRAPHAGALVSDEVRVVTQHQVVDERDLPCHGTP